MSVSRSRRTALFLVVSASVALAAFGLRPEARTSSNAATDGEGRDGLVSTATPELAARTVDRLQLFRTGNAGSRISLTADEVTALLRHAMPGVLPSGVDAPSVRLEAGTVLVGARIATEDFAGNAPLAAVLGVLPDTVGVELRGRLATDTGRLVFEVESAKAAGVPLPLSAVASIAAGLAATADRLASSEGDAWASLSVAWPEGFALVAVVGDRLVLDRDEPKVDRAVDGSDDP